jgi:hypothetical protein
MSEGKRVSVWKSALEGGVLIGAAQIIGALIAYLLGMQTGMVPLIITISILISALIFVQMRFRDNLNGGFISYGRAYGFVVVSGIYAGLIYAGYHLLYLNFIDPGFSDRQMEFQYNEMLGKGMSEGQIEMSMKYMKMGFASTWQGVSAVIGTIFVCAFLGLITSAVAMKNEPNRGF